MTLFRQMGLWFAVLCVTFLITAALVAAQTGKGEKSQNSDDFPREKGIVSGDTVFSFPKKPAFHSKGTKTPVRHYTARSTKAIPSKSNLPNDAKSPEVFKRLGVTVWRLESNKKPVTGDNETARILVQEEGDNREYTPARVSGDTIFQLGDRVRLSFESPTAGYLYVFDRELYEGDKVGEPYLIFPTRAARGGENRVLANSVVDVPSLSDRTPFFTLEKKGAGNYRGELLTVIVSPQPLTDVPMLDRPSPISEDLVAALENKYEKAAEQYEQASTAGKSYTKAEKAAATDGTRQLTQDDPFPQTYYKVKTREKEPMLVNLSLAVK